MILIDNRVGSRELKPYISKGIHTKLTRLDYGDASWLGNGPDGSNTMMVGVERKTLSDFFSSMVSGRLANHQLVGMANTYHVSYVVVEGVWRPGKKSGLVEVYRRGKWGPLKLGSQSFTVSAMDNFINTLECLLSTRVKSSFSVVRTANWISNVYKWWTAKAWDQHRSCSGKVVKAGLTVPFRGKVSLVARMALELRGVGPKGAMTIADRYKTPEALCAATSEELMELEGIGPTIAESIWREIHG